ncbi:hypothetical protein L7F22_000211 [Adiantum nelumboides]|nr:hypothetical protein [Adiantum nelumboides]
MFSACLPEHRHAFQHQHKPFETSSSAKSIADIRPTSVKWHRWGSQLEQATYKNRQRLYLSEQYTDGTVPNTLVIANCEVVKPRVAAAEHISQFNEEARSPFVNRIRELPQKRQIVATHTDGPEVFVWNVDTNQTAKLLLVRTLTGHTDNAEFALALSPAAPHVLSGGLSMCGSWSIEDFTTSAKDPSPFKPATPTGGKQKVVGHLSPEWPTLRRLDLVEFSKGTQKLWRMYSFTQPVIKNSAVLETILA